MAAIADCLTAANPGVSCSGEAKHDIHQPKYYNRPSKTHTSPH
ncbi:hypothetical protein KP77_26710 [Jeotgalibacillus alimentarius]|uniref:Uncharacterized protein n=1 Tax=Jeotgalibacillus alimentarius TaxID=135826 RepID=A0A0C2RXR7_9BACL|nr:hypothetical protein KP77_26710 [Jeotgalibacillus alimentarius]